MFNAIAALCYIGAFGGLTLLAARRTNLRSPYITVLICLGILFHGAGAYFTIRTETGFDLGFFKVASLIFWVISIVVLLSSLRKPMWSLFLLLLPLTLIALGCATLANTDPSAVITLSPGIFAHILLSILSYSLLTIATLQAILLAYQNRMLKQKHPRGVMGLLPPLQTMEGLMFELLWAGEILLTLAILSGVIFIENILAQHLAHKTVFSIVSWIIYAILLWGRFRFGWRGAAAIRWALGGFAALMLAYFGSKLVLEIILG